MLSPVLVEHDTVALASIWRGVVDVWQHPYRQRVRAGVCGELLLLKKGATKTPWDRLPLMDAAEPLSRMLPTAYAS